MLLFPPVRSNIGTSQNAVVRGMHDGLLHNYYYFALGKIENTVRGGGDIPGEQAALRRRDLWGEEHLLKTIFAGDGEERMLNESGPWAAGDLTCSREELHASVVLYSPG